MQLPLLDDIYKKISSGNEGAELYVSLPIIVGIYVSLNLLFLLLWPTQMIINIILLIILSVFWVPLLLGRFWIVSSIKTRRAKFIADAKHVLLEVILPPEIKTSPLTMEAFFTSMHIGPGESNWYKKYYKGTARPWFSFEIASFGGNIRFFIWTRIPLRSAIENFLYSQYPTIQIIETEDYSLLRDPSTPDMNISAFEFKKSKPSPLPIKPLSAHEKQKVDPLTQILEFMGSLPEGEELWLQYVARVSKSELGRGADYKWAKEGEKIIKKMREHVKKVAAKEGEEMDPGEKEVVNAIHHNIAKLPFDVGIRVIYSCPKPASLSNGMVVPNMFKSFESEVYNKLTLCPVLGNKTQGFPWEDTDHSREKREMVRGVAMYRRRQFFHPPYRGEWTIMSAEELATLYHFPERKTRRASVVVNKRPAKPVPDNLPI